MGRYMEAARRISLIRKSMVRHPVAVVILTTCSQIYWTPLVALDLILGKDFTGPTQTMNLKWHRPGFMCVDIHSS
jgi:hypothetical protein